MTLQEARDKTELVLERFFSRHPNGSIPKYSLPYTDLLYSVALLVIQERNEVLLDHAPHVLSLLEIPKNPVAEDPKCVF